MAEDAKLLAALAERNLKAARSALSEGANANYSGEDGGTPLHTLAYDFYSDVVNKLAKILLEHGADINAADGQGFTPLMVACLNANTRMVRLLLENRADLHITRKDCGETALHLAMDKNSFDTATILLDHGADVYAKTQDKSTALHLAAEFGNRHSAMALLNHPISERKMLLRDEDDQGRIPAKVATENNNKDLAHLLDVLESPLTDADEKMINAIIDVDVEALQESLDVNADVNLLTRRGDRPLHAAALQGSPQIIRALLVKKANFDAVDCSGYTPLMIASLNGHINAVQELLSFNAKPNKTSTEDKVTALHLAMVNDCKDIVKLLLENGADINCTAIDGSTPLHYAAKSNALSAGDLLLKNDLIKMDLADKNGYTPYDLASIERNNEFIQILNDARGKDLDWHYPGSLESSSDTDESRTSLNLTVRYGQLRTPDSNIYKNVTTPRGRVLIINNIFEGSKKYYREGSEADSRNLKNLFEKMGYDVQLKEDQHDTLKTLEEFSQDPELGQYDSVFVFLLSHGNEGKFLTYDDEILEENKVYDLFKDSRCPHLKDKPKVIMFNFCRGDSLEERTKVYIKDTQYDAESMGTVKIPEDLDQTGKESPDEENKKKEENKLNEAPKDLLAIFASTEGMKALRDPLEGTFLVKGISSIFAQYAHLEPIRTLTDRLCKYMRNNHFTTPEVKSYDFSKAFYLNPYERD